METKPNVQRCQNLNVFVFLNAPTKGPGIARMPPEWSAVFGGTIVIWEQGASLRPDAGRRVARALEAIDDFENT